MIWSKRLGGSRCRTVVPGAPFTPVPLTIRPFHHRECGFCFWAIFLSLALSSSFLLSHNTPLLRQVSPSTLFSCCLFVQPSVANGETTNWVLLVLAASRLLPPSKQKTVLTRSNGFYVVLAFIFFSSPPPLLVVFFGPRRWTFKQPKTKSESARTANTPSLLHSAVQVLSSRCLARAAKGRHIMELKNWVGSRCRTVASGAPLALMP